MFIHFFFCYFAAQDNMNGPNSDLQSSQNHPNFNAYTPHLAYGTARVGVPSQAMPSSHSNFNSSHHTSRAGSTPTLNQLLQSPNSGPRYHTPSGYADFVQSKGGPAPDMPGANSVPYTPNWNNPRQIGPYQDQAPNAYNSQVSTIFVFFLQHHYGDCYWNRAE